MSYFPVLLTHLLTLLTSSSQSAAQPPVLAVKGSGALTFALDNGLRYKMSLLEEAYDTATYDFKKLVDPLVTALPESPTCESFSATLAHSRPCRSCGGDNLLYSLEKDAESDFLTLLDSETYPVEKRLLPALCLDYKLLVPVSSSLSPTTYSSHTLVSAEGSEVEAGGSDRPNVCALYFPQLHEDRLSTSVSVSAFPSPSFLSLLTGHV